ncbi:MAG: bifunctional DNA primase/polymerase, partial [Thioalkalivibrio sp.]|nr:bifunctional DNA primase/polymerase [Thioalkalivibrio sp.]
MSSALEQHGSIIGPDKTSGLARDALFYARLGYPVFPCKPGGKAPATPHGFKDATRDPTEIRAAFKKGTNVGLIAPEDVIVLDVDKQGLVDVLEATCPELANAPRHRTANGRAHLFVRVPNGWMMPTRVRVVDGIDIRGLARAYVIAPGSRVEGKDYRVVRPLASPDQLPVASRALFA